LVEDIASKIILLRATRHAMPMPIETTEQEELFWTLWFQKFQLSSTNDFVTTPDWQDTRYGVRAFHHPILLTELEETSPAITLLGLIDQANIWEVQSEVWAGTALQLRAQLLQNQKTSRDAAKLLDWINACGQHLNDSARMRPNRVRRLQAHAGPTYEIYR
jgi:hypothetical protein